MQNIEDEQDTHYKVETQTNKLTAEEIKDMGNQAMLRLQALERIKSACTPMGGDTGESLKREDLYKQQFSEDTPGINDILMVAVRKLPSELDSFVSGFDAHGITRGKPSDQLTALTELLDGGKLEGSTGALKGSPVNAWVEGFTIIGPANSDPEAPRKMLKKGDGSVQIGAVLVDRHFYFAVPRLHEVYPDVKFIKAKELEAEMTHWRDNLQGQ
jgi:hypothetical protein